MAPIAPRRRRPCRGPSTRWLLDRAPGRLVHCPVCRPIGPPHLRHDPPFRPDGGQRGDRSGPDNLGGDRGAAPAAVAGGLRPDRVLCHPPPPHRGPSRREPGALPRRRHQPPARAAAGSQAEDRRDLPHRRELPPDPGRSPDPGDRRGGLQLPGLVQGSEGDWPALHLGGLPDRHQRSATGRGGGEHRACRQR